ncbi:MULTISPECIES: hypothetical protein [unclassified Bradyrhizobium]
MTHWWRAYDDAIDHPKLLRLSDSEFRAWFTLQCIASANGGVLPPTDDIALRLREKPAKVALWLAVLVKAKLVDNVDGVFRPHNWDGRQFQSDSSTPRVKRFRDKQRNASGNGKRNVSETGSETAPEQSRADSETEQSRAEGGCAPVDEDLKRRASAVGAAVSALFLGRQLPIPNLSRCEHWLREGYAQGTILAAVETVLKRGTKPATLDYFDGAIRDAHAKAPPAAGLQVVSQQVFIVEGTMEWACWDQHLRATTGRGSPVTDNRDENGRLRRGWFRPTLVPEGYDEATGERLPREAEDAA